MPSFVGATLTLFTAENRQKLRADELRREYYEEQRNEFENFVEEQNDGKSSSLASSGRGFVGKSYDLSPLLPNFYLSCFIKKLISSGLSLSHTRHTHFLAPLVLLFTLPPPFQMCTIAGTGLKPLSGAKNTSQVSHVGGRNPTS